MVLVAHGGAAVAQGLRLRSAAPRGLHSPSPSHTRLASDASGVPSVSLVAVAEQQHFRPQLVSLSGVVAAKVVDRIEYMREHGGGAVPPALLHRMQTSHHFLDMSEVRDMLLGQAKHPCRTI